MDDHPEWKPTKQRPWLYLYTWGDDALIKGYAQTDDAAVTFREAAPSRWRNDIDLPLLMMRTEIVAKSPHVQIFIHRDLIK